MEERKRIKKTCGDNEEEPSSHVLEDDDEKGQGSEVKQVNLHDLPPEMLTEILKFVDTRNLLTCRLVDRGWREISSGILCTRTDSKVSFEFDWKEFSCGIGKRKQNLKGFLSRMRRSKNVPYARFAFSVSCGSCNSVASQFFDHPDFVSFVSQIGSNPNPNKNQMKIKALELKLVFSSYSSCTEWIGKLSAFLVNTVPHLEEFGLDLVRLPVPSASGSASEVDVQNVQIFPPSETIRDFKLPLLKVLHFNGAMTSKFPTILVDIIKAAGGLRKINVYKKDRFENEDPCPTKTYDFLHSLRKFHLLKKVQFHVDDKFLEKVKARPDFTRALFNLEPEELELDLDLEFKLNRDSDNDTLTQIQSRARAANFISGLLESGKDSLLKLTMAPLGALAALQFPRLKKLTTLALKIHRHFITNPRPIFFPPGVRSMDIFPAVSELDLSYDWCGAFPHENSIPILPDLKSLSVEDSQASGFSGFREEHISVLALLCPNLLHLRVHRQRSKDKSSSPKLNFLLVGPQIWRLMTQLESLEIDIDVDLNLPGNNNNSSALNSCFTGISIQNCQRLGELLEAQKILEKWGSEAKIPEAQLIAEREHPSILNMTRLKRLVINPYAKKKLLDRNHFLTHKLSCTQEYAFKFMPQLKVD